MLVTSLNFKEFFGCVTSDLGLYWVFFMFCDLTRNAWPNLVKDAKTKQIAQLGVFRFLALDILCIFLFVSVCVCFYTSVLCFILSFNCRLLLIIFTFDYPCGFFGFGFTTFN